MSFLGWRTWKGFRPENVFLTALIVDFARFYSAALGGILLIDPEILWEISTGYLGRKIRMFFVARHVSQERSRLYEDTRRFYVPVS